jgi:hypothetical protein
MAPISLADVWSALAAAARLKATAVGRRARGDAAGTTGKLL